MVGGQANLVSAVCAFAITAACLLYPGTARVDLDAPPTFDPAPEARAFVTEAKALVGQAERCGQNVIVGQHGWHYFVPELRSVCCGPFWGEHAADVSRASNPDHADPVGAIVDFNEQLEGAGIRLLVVPVPAKAHVYPEYMSETAAAWAPDPNGRLDPWHQEFYGLLRGRGVEVLDLLPLLLRHRDDPEGGSYCKTDSHWSPRACALAAALIAERIRTEPWATLDEPSRYVTEQRSIEISGDLARLTKTQPPAKEQLAATFVGQLDGDVLRSLDVDRESAVLLMGDSHVLVFHDPTLYAKGAGLPDHLALQLGFPVDLVAVRGSGANVCRIALMRRRDNLKGKKVVIWCFSVREFTECESGWRQVPVVRPPGPAS